MIVSKTLSCCLVLLSLIKASQVLNIWRFLLWVFLTRQNVFLVLIYDCIKCMTWLVLIKKYDNYAVIIVFLEKKKRTKMHSFFLSLCQHHNYHYHYLFFYNYTHQLLFSFFSGLNKQTILAAYKSKKVTKYFLITRSLKPFIHPWANNSKNWVLTSNQLLIIVY